MAGTRCHRPLAYVARLALAVALPAQVAAATPANPRFTGTPLLRVWRGEDYGASLLNTRVLVAPSDLVYVANDDGVLEFDGEQWRLIRLPRGGAARALVCDARGRIWVFGHDDVARLEPNAHGELHAMSALESVPADAQPLGTINRAVVTADGVYARGQSRLMLFRPDGRVQTWPGANAAGLIWTLDGALYAELDRLVRVSPTSVEPVALGDPAAKNSASTLRVFATQADAGTPGRWLLLTGRGPATWRGAGTPIEPLVAENASPLARDLGSAGAFLADGRLAIGTERSGLFIFDRDGRLSQHVDREQGLPGNRVNDLAVDEQGGLWLALQEGIARLDVESPLAVHRTPQGLTGTPRRFASWRGQLFVSQAEGVSRRDPVTGRFVSVAGFQVGANRPLLVGDRLVASTRGLREITADDRSRAWTDELIGPIAALARAPGWIAAGASTGLWLLRPNAAGGWETLGRVATIDRGIDDVLDTGDGWLWAVTRNGEVARVDFRDGPRLDAPARFYSPETGIPAAGRDEHVELLPIGRELFAFSKSWMRRYQPREDSFTPESRPVLRDLHVRGANPVGRTAAAGAWLRPGQRREWLLRVEPGADEQWVQSEFSIAPLRGLSFDSIYEEPTTHTLWLAAQGELVSFDLDWKPSRPEPPLRVTIRRVETGAGELLLGGELPERELELASAQDALHISFAAQTYRADYRGRDPIAYRTKLDGLDRSWTPWSADIRRDFTNLPYRHFVLHVQARTPDGPEGEAPPLAFAIAAPWWLTRWAWLGYGGLGLVAVAGFVRWRTSVLHTRAERLEAAVAARTEDLHRSNLELARLHRLELDEKTAARLAEEQARLELLRYQLNPHFLFNAFTTLRSIVFSRPEAAGEMVGRLADFCRLALTRNDASGGTAADEAKLIETYLATEKARWRDDLACSVTLDPAVGHVRLPPFLLQPLVENAVKYGGATSPGKLEVRVTIAPLATATSAGALRIEVANTGTWVEADGQQPAASTGIGLNNLRQRLRRYYPGAHTLGIRPDAGWVRIELQLHQPARDPFAPSHPDHR